MGTSPRVLLQPGSQTPGRDTPRRCFSAWPAAVSPQGARLRPGGQRGAAHGGRHSGDGGSAPTPRHGEAARRWGGRPGAGAGSGGGGHSAVSRGSTRTAVQKCLHGCVLWQTSARMAGMAPGWVWLSGPNATFRMTPASGAALLTREPIRRRAARLHRTVWGGGSGRRWGVKDCVPTQLCHLGKPTLA